MKKYLINYWKPVRNPHIVGYFYDTRYKEVIKTKDIEKAIKKIKKEVENFKTSIFPNHQWSFYLVDVKEI